MKGFCWFLLALLTVAPAFAKPKVDVKFKVNDGFAKDQVSDKLSQTNNPTPGTVFYATVYYLNVTVTSDNAEAVAKNNGQWCLSTDTKIDIKPEYQGVLDGNGLDIQVPGKNGKTKKVHLEVFDHRWRKLSDIN